MKNRISTSVSALCLGLALLLTAAAHAQQKGNPADKHMPKEPMQQQLPPVASYKVNLQCKVQPNDVAPKAKITNSTSKIVPVGTTIFWQAGSFKSQLKLNSALQPNASLTVTGTGANSSWDGGGDTCTAYYTK